MGDGYFQLGNAIVGSPDIAAARTKAELEGLNTGSQISLRNAQTQDALTKARERQRKAQYLEGIGDALENAGYDRSLAPIVQAGAGADFRDFTKGMENTQGMDFRDVLADPNATVAERQGAGLALRGEPITSKDVFGPGGELTLPGLFEGTFDPSVTPTGRVQIGADEALANQRNTAAALNTAKVEHPENYYKSATINVGGSGVPLGDAILAQVEGTDTTLPEDADYSAALGAAGWGAHAVNAVFDVAEAGVPFPNIDKARNALQDLYTRTQIVSQQAIPGRPSNYLMQQLSAFGVEPSTLTRGDERSLYRLQQTSNYLAGEVQRLRDMANAGTAGGLTKADLSKTATALRDLASLKRDYDIAISKLSAEDSGTEKPKKKETGLGDAVAGYEQQVGETVDRGNGVTITRTK